MCKKGSRGGDIVTARSSKNSVCEQARYLLKRYGVPCGSLQSIYQFFSFYLGLLSSGVVNIGREELRHYITYIDIPFVHTHITALRDKERCIP